MKHEEMPIHEQACRDQGHSHLDGAGLHARMATIGAIKGLYQPPFHFVGSTNADGTLTGRNNFGTEDVGRWQVEGDTLRLTWQNYWDHTVTRVYEVDEILHFFDAETGAWRMSFSAA